MADPTLNLTFDKLRIRVSEFLGNAYYGANGDQAAQLPVDAGDLELVGRLVNDGYARFLDDNQWNFLRVPLTLTFLTGTVSADNSRYYLPDDFTGELLSKFTYPAAGPRISIENVDEERLRSLQAGSSVSGYPSIVAVRAINTVASTTSQRWEALFWPTPTTAVTVTARYRRYPAALSASGDTSVAGFAYDRTVLAAAIAAAELQRNDEQGPREAFYQTLLKQSIARDKKTAARSLGDYGDKSDDATNFGRRPLNYYGVSTYNGVSIE